MLADAKWHKCHYQTYLCILANDYIYHYHASLINNDIHYFRVSVAVVSETWFSISWPFCGLLNNTEGLKSFQVLQLPCCDRQQSSGGAVNLARGHLKGSRRIHEVSLPFIPVSDSLVYSVMVNVLMSREREGERKERERGMGVASEVLSLSYYSSACGDCDSIGDTISYDATQFLMMLSPPTGTRGWPADPIVSLSQSLMCHWGRCQVTHTWICLVPTPKQRWQRWHHNKDDSPFQADH